ncbi:MAG: rubrerythrin family protein, partial [Deltaproteobacteria bacterium]|nr:rubrerythrin family protein [Deltaproteobacteria bacterium]
MLLLLSRELLKLEAVAAAGHFPLTLAALKDAYDTEMEAHHNYVAFSKKADSEKYHNIAYLFTAFAISEKIHADNFSKCFVELDKAAPVWKGLEVNVATTKKNIRRAAKHELQLIDYKYPELLKHLQHENYEKALRYCKYALESHQQHREHISQIVKYSGIFFRFLVREFEKNPVDYFVCLYCGSTVIEVPLYSCSICSEPVSWYRKIPKKRG